MWRYIAAFSDIFCKKPTLDESVTAYRDGYQACIAGKPETSVPENVHTSGDWLDGWHCANREKQVEARIDAGEME